MSCVVFAIDGKKYMWCKIMCYWSQPTPQKAVTLCVYDKEPWLKHNRDCHNKEQYYLASETIIKLIYIVSLLEHCCCCCALYTTRKSVLYTFVLNICLWTVQKTEMFNEVSMFHGKKGLTAQQDNGSTQTLLLSCLLSAREQRVMSR